MCVGGGGQNLISSKQFFQDSKLFCVFVKSNHTFILKTQFFFVTRLIRQLTSDIVIF